jgi:putative ABC transport system permease protein
MNQVWLRRILRELAANRSRTALTVLSIAVGLFAVSLTFRTQAILSRNVLDAYSPTIPAAIVVQVLPADPQLAATLRTIPGVRSVEAVSHLSARVQISSTWRALALWGVDDMAHMQANRLAPGDGAWPAPRHAMLFERSYMDGAGVQIGDSLPIELEDGRRHQLAVAGSAQDLAVTSGRLGGPVLHGYISLDTAESLTGSHSVNEFLIAVDDDRRADAALQTIADRVDAKLRDAGCTVVNIRIRDPSVPEVYPILTAVFQMLSALGILSLALSACLVVNTTSALLARHVPQIGIMKAIGARSSTIFGTYLGMILLIALIALLIALPLAALCAWLLATQLAWLLNYDIRQISVSPGVVAIELAAGIVAPLLASAYPIHSAARVTVREALASIQSGTVGTSGSSRLRTPIPGVPIALLYAARSMFRRKARLALTLAALACGGAIVITVISTRASLFTSLDQVAAYWQQDLTVSFNQPERSARVASEARQVPGVVGVEQQPATLAVRLRPGGGESEQRYAIFGVEPESSLIRPTLIQGRWLRPQDRDAIVINAHFLKHEPTLALGDQLELKIDGRTTAWRIVGVATTHLLLYGEANTSQGVGYISAAAYTREIIRSQRTNRIIITTAQHDAASQAQVGQALEAHFAQAGIQALVQTRGDIHQQISGFLSLIVVLLLVMALSFVAIGGLSLVGAMSLNVLERTKEIGILRAIGSAHRQVASIVVIEGVCIGVLSWVPATLLALPLSKLLSDTLGWSILSWPLIYVFPPAAPLLWIGVVVLLSAGASYMPARHAARINVRDALDHQ